LARVGEISKSWNDYVDPGDSLITINELAVD
jgi:hypothetical protein